MQLGETITLARKDAAASTGYRLSLVKLENFALTDIARTVTHLPAIGPANVTFTFQAVKEGRGVIQFARYRPWDPFHVVYEKEVYADIKKPDPDLKPGGWTPFRAPDPETVKIFKEAVLPAPGSEPGPDYGDPLLVTSQVAAGANYIFVANQTLFIPPPFGRGRVSAVLVRVRKPLKGPATVSAVEQLSCPVPESAWSAVYGPAAKLDAWQQEIFDEVNNSGGNSFAAFLAAPQTMGSGFAVFASDTRSAEKTEVVPVLVTIQILPPGVPVITGVQEIYHLV